jgi:hypothetical protein
LSEYSGPVHVWGSAAAGGRDVTDPRDLNTDPADRTIGRPWPFITDESLLSE